MRIAIDMSHAHKTKTGISTYTKNILKALKKLDYKNEYIHFQAPSFFKSKNFFTRLINAALDILWRQIALPSKLSGYKIDMLYCPSFYTPLISRAKTVVAIFDIIFLHYPKELGFLWNTYLKISTKIAVKKADKIITTSNYSKKDIQDNFNALPEKIEIISGAVDQKFQVINNEHLISGFRKKYNLKHEFFMYAGAVSSHKNTAILIKSFYLFKKNHDNFKLEKFNLIFSGSDKTPPENIHKLIKKFGLENDVIFIGFLPEEDLILLYNAAKIFIFPSLYEGFGLPPLEAMACGTPVISSNATSLPEVIGNAGILVNPLNAEGFAEAIVKIISDDNLKKQLMENGFIQAKKFSWGKSAEKLLGIFKDLNN